MYSTKSAVFVLTVLLYYSNSIGTKKPYHATLDRLYETQTGTKTFREAHSGLREANPKLHDKAPECRILNDIQSVDMNEPLNQNIMSVDTQSKITYNLLTRNNPIDAEVLKINDDITSSDFDNTKTSVVLIHGWNGNAEVLNDLAAAFLEDDDINVFNVDWSSIAQEDYISARAKVPDVGVAIAQFLNWLSTEGLSFDKVHVVGHSLGAHVAGFVSKEAQSRVARITGLDPASIGFYTDDDRLKSDDAEFVEVFHTNTALFGIGLRSGDVDVYPSGGAIMPACASEIRFNRCSHFLSIDFLIVSLLYPDHFIANKCGSVLAATLLPCNGETFVVGTSNLTKSGSGVYRMETGTVYPY